MVFSYKQPIKNNVRERILGNAIQSLTTNRSMSTIVLPEELRNTVEYALDILNDSTLNDDTLNELDRWLQNFSNHVGKKKPSELRVLYLCGPEPLNDLKVLLNNGVNPQNIWAVESVGENIGPAVKELSKTYPEVRFHPGDLSDLLRVYPSRFDIVYYDACGSIFRDKVLDPLLYLIRDVKLEPLSVLISNFSDVPLKYRNECIVPLVSYFRYRNNDLPKVFWEATHLDPPILEHDDHGLAEHIQQYFESYYSDFTTRFISDLARCWIPNCRALALRAISDNYLIESKELRKHLEKAQFIPESTESVKNWLQKVGHMALSPSSYPLLSFYEDLKRKKHSFAKKIGELKIDDQKIDQFLKQASMLEKVFEGHWDGVNDAMKKAILLSWFDRDNHFSCDVPLPNLIVNSLLGIYGHPYFPNPKKSERLTYTAKQTKMFTDVFVFDQCRYYYDWFPTILLSPDRFKSKSFQIIARCILDRIGWSDYTSSSHPFRGAAVACMGQIPSAQPSNFSPRKDL